MFYIILLMKNKVNNDRDRPANYLPDLVVVSLMGHLINVGEALYFYEFQKCIAKIESFLERVTVDVESLSSLNKFESHNEVKVQVVKGFFPFPNVGNCLPNSVVKLAFQVPFSSVFYAAQGAIFN